MPMTITTGLMTRQVASMGFASAGADAISVEGGISGTMRSHTTLGAGYGRLQITGDFREPAGIGTITLSRRAVGDMLGKAAGRGSRHGAVRRGLHAQDLVAHDCCGVDAAHPGGARQRHSPNTCDR